MPEHADKIDDPEGWRSFNKCRMTSMTMAESFNVQAVEADPLVVFMKGTPQIPQCGFSRAVCQIMEVQVGLRIPNAGR